MHVEDAHENGDARERPRTDAAVRIGQFPRRGRLDDLRDESVSRRNDEVFPVGRRPDRVAEEGENPERQAGRQPAENFPVEYEPEHERQHGGGRDELGALRVHGGDFVFHRGKIVCRRQFTLHFAGGIGRRPRLIRGCYVAHAPSLARGAHP